MILKCLLKASIQKLGNSRDENEDNFLLPDISEDNSILRLAIADGATESSFSKEWSQILVNGYADKSFNKIELPKTIADLSESWTELANNMELPWYAQQKFETGAFATFLGVTIELKNATYQAVAIGDCTLFHVRNNKMYKSFPTSSKEDFGNTPDLIASNSKYQSEFEISIKNHDDEIQAGDIFIVVTDAIAAWIFGEIENGREPWNHLFNILTIYPDDFENWLNNLRKEDKLKNDDVSLLLLKFEK